METLLTIMHTFDFSSVQLFSKSQWNSSSSANFFSICRIKCT